MKLASIAAILALAFAADQRVPVATFSAGDLDGWDTKTFRGTTEYELVEEQGRRAVRAVSRGTASGRYKRIRVDLTQTPYLHWSWKIERVLTGNDETVKAGDDYAARVYVVFSTGPFFWNTRAVNYVWASSQPPGATWPNAFTANAQMLALRSGNHHAGRWVDERRNVRADYRRLFGADIRYVEAVAIMTDTDNTKGSATAYYGDIYFSSD